MDASVVQVLTCRPTTEEDKQHMTVHAKTPGFERKLDVVREDGIKASILFWTGPNGNTVKASVNMCDFEDKQRGVMRRVTRNLKFDIAQPCTRVCLETTGRSPSEAKAVLLIRGKLTTGGSPHEFFAAAQNAPEAEGGAAMGRSFGEIPGVITKVFLQSRERDGVVGGVYLFLDAASRDEYLESELWQSARDETPWADLTIEKYEVVSELPAAAA